MNPSDESRSPEPEEIDMNTTETTETTNLVAEVVEATQQGSSDLEERIVEAIKTIYDPEIPVNIYELGLIYNVAVGEKGHIDVVMTLTSPACPVAGSLPGEVQAKVESVDGVESADVEIVWDPIWNPSMMSEAARLELGML